MRNEWLKAISLAAAPTFAIMALHTGSQHDMVCAVAQGASPLSGMAWMYTLMSVFHSPPWLKLIAQWRIASPRAVSRGVRGVQDHQQAM
ncbi:MAG TPA: hypothetical protein VMV19_11680 [Xanthobacteraceae bacterium]|nr:hypothetical protein [Xanthobacteraceae bacterium]